MTRRPPKSTRSYPLLPYTTRLRSRYVAVAAAQQQLEFARERVKLAEQIRAEVARWVEAARNPASDLRAAEIALAEAELEVEDAEHELTSARMTLADRKSTRLNSSH